MAVVKADALRARRRQSARAAAGRAAPTGSASPTSPRRMALRAAGITRRARLAARRRRRLRARDRRAASTSASQLSSQLEQRRLPRHPAATARVHLKLDTGLSRNGIARGAVARRLRSAPPNSSARAACGSAGVFSHLSNTSPDDDAAQLEAFEQRLAAADDAGLDPELRHLAAVRRRRSRARAPGSTCSHRDRRSTGSRRRRRHRRAPPSGSARDGPCAARSRRCAGSPPGTGRLYGYTASHRARHDARPRARSATPTASRGRPRARAEVAIGGAGARSSAASRWTSSWSTSATTRSPSATRSCSSATRRRGAQPPTTGRDAAGTIGYEIVTRVGPRVPRTYVGVSE